MARLSGRRALVTGVMANIGERIDLADRLQLPAGPSRLPPSRRDRAFIASNSSAFIPGAIIAVDGGLRLSRRPHPLGDRDVTSGRDR